MSGTEQPQEKPGDPHATVSPGAGGGSQQEAPSTSQDTDASGDAFATCPPVVAHSPAGIEDSGAPAPPPDKDVYATGPGTAAPAGEVPASADAADPYATALPAAETQYSMAQTRFPESPESESVNSGSRFRVLQLHAKGGLGQVSVAHDRELHREVALKEIQSHYADDHESRDRFLREARITGRLEHPGIVPVYGLGHYADGRPYYAMRFIKGDSLQEAIDAFHQADGPDRDHGQRSLDLHKLLDRFVDICNAIAYAHSRSVLHRDLKPGNVMLGQFGETLVVDWGLAKVLTQPESGAGTTERSPRPLQAVAATVTQMGQAMGTPQFMSPEQAAGQLDRLGPPSDVYSLGATLYCLLTGRPLFLGDDAGMILRQVQNGEFPSPRTLDPSIDPALEAVCLTAMATKPEDRY